MPAKNCICIVVDRLHSGMVGTYGNSWIHTDRIDQLAAESFLFDQAFIANADLAATYRALWLGSASDRGAAGSSLAKVLAAAAWHTALVTDEPQVAALPQATEFNELQLVESTPDATAAEDPGQAQMAQLFSAAADWLQAPREPFLLWLHARGPAGPWDAPWEFRARYADAEDPEPPHFTEVPNRLLAEDYDPDDLLGIVHAYAGQVSLLDLCIGALVDRMHEANLASSTQVTLISARGFPLGEHRRVGLCDGALYNELAQLVWLMRFPDGTGRLDRSQSLVGPADLPGTLLDWLGVDRAALGSARATSLMPMIHGECESLHDRALLRSPNERALRTAAWHLREPATGPAELYAKPSDRWEVNEVANLCPEVVSAMQAALEETARVVESGNPGDLSPLPHDLVAQID